MRKLLYFCMGVFTGICILAFTQLGLKLIIKLSELVIPGLHIEKVSGQLNSDIQLEKILYKNDGTNIEINKITLKWDLLSSIRNMKLEIYNIMIDQPLILYKPDVTVKSQKNNKIKDILYPIKYFNIHNLIIKNIKIIYNNETIPIPKIILSKLPYADPYYIKIDLFKGSVLGDITLSLSDNMFGIINLTGKNITVSPNYFISQLNFDLNSEWKSNPSSQLITFKLPMDGLINNKLLSSQINVVVENENVLVNLLKIRLGTNHIDIQGSISQWNPKLNVNLKLMNLNEIQSDLSGSLLFRGTVINKAGFSYLNGTLKAEKLKLKTISVKHVDGNVFANLAKQESTINIRAQKIKISQYQLPNLKLNMLSHFSDKNLSNQFYIEQNKEKILRGDINLSNETINGEIKLHINDVKKYVKINRIRNITGNIQGKFNISGSLNQPLITGETILSQGQFYIEPLAITLKKIKLQAQLNNKNTINLSGSFSSGYGLGQINTLININKIYPISIKLKGNDLQIANSPEYQITFSPDLKLDIDPNIFYLSGDVTLPNVKIMVKQYHHALTMPDETIIIDQNQATSTLPHDLNIALNLHLGKNISVTYKELKANLAGSLRISKLTGGLATASGTLYVQNGSYQIYKRLFNIQQGRLFYIGNTISNPGLDIKAIKPINFVNTIGETNQETMEYVGAYIQGTLEDPRVTLISNPPLSQNEILSQLVFGNSMENIGSNNLPLLRDIASQLNILSPNLSDTTIEQHGFKFDLFNPLQSFNLRYNLSKNWSFITKTTFQETSGDLFFVYEH